MLPPETQSYAATLRVSVDDDRAALRRIQGQMRYVFSETEFSDLTGREKGGMASQMALQRLSKAGHIALAHKRPARWLIVPPEHDHYGAPPIDWWLDDLMSDLEPDYYLALLSAARVWGSAHYAYQPTQVMVSRPRRPLSIGKLRLEFVVKKNLATTPIVRQRTATAYLRVSTREATMLDLVRHQTAVGGLEAVARIAHDLAAKTTSAGLLAALRALDQVPAAQRLGFVLDQLGHLRQASTIASWLRLQRCSIQPLETASTVEQALLRVSDVWRIEYTQRQEQTLKEIRG